MAIIEIFKLEDDVLVLLSKNIGSFLLFRIVICTFSFLLPSCKNFGILSSSITLLFIGDLFQSIEFLSIKFVKFGINI